MRRPAGPAIEVQPRLATVVPELWPVKVFPAHDELLSSWLHRLALGHGLSPRHFGECLGVGGSAGAWSARLDLALPEFLLNLLHHQTGVDPHRIAAMTIGGETWRPLLLPFRRAQTDRTCATWLQFCPACLAEDETPYFRRAWRRASVMTCRRHQRGLLDRCPACGQGLAPFKQRGLVPQHRCVVCAFNLRRAQASELAPATRRAAELLDDLVRLEAAKGFLGKSTLIRRIIALPSLQEPPSNASFTKLSTTARIHCVTRVGNCFDQRFEKHLCAERDARIAGWRWTIVAAGGIDASARPLLHRLTSRVRLRNDRQPKSRNRKGGAGASLHSLLVAYGAVQARREDRMRSGSIRYKPSAVSSSSASSNSEPSSSERPKAPSSSASV